MEKIRASIQLPERTRCNSPTCNKYIRNPMSAIFLVRMIGTLVFCCPECYTKATEHYLDQVRATDALKGKSDIEMLKGLGYRPGETLIEEE